MLPAPAVRDVSARPQALLVTGIGGTGVLTVGAILAMAAHLEGKAAKVLDQTGMAQKGGAVTSHVRIGADSAAIPSARLGTGQADVLIACDLIVGSGARRARPGAARHAGAGQRGRRAHRRIPDVTATSIWPRPGSSPRSASASHPRTSPRLRAGALATRLLGDSIFTNLMMVGFAAQNGLLPVSLAAIEEAIGLNGIAVTANLQALALGRLAAHSAEDLLALADAPSEEPSSPLTLDELAESRANRLAKWQNQAWAGAYRAFVEETRKALESRGLGPESSSAGGALLIEVARGLGKLMAYKDEYEVARLYTDPAFMVSLRDRFAGDPTLKINLAPPLLPLGKDAKTGRPTKIAFPAWLAFPMFRVLAKLKGLRGTAFDVFGYTAERRLERALIGEYRDLVNDVVARVTWATMPVAVELAAAADLICGYGPVKDAGVAAYRARVAELLPVLDAARQAPVLQTELEIA